VKVVVIGAGGHARSVIDALRSEGRHEPVACTDPQPELRGSRVDDVPVVGDDEHLEALRSEGVTGAALGVGGIGDNGPRARLFELARGLGFELPPVVHPSAAVSARASLSDGAVVLANAAVGPGAVVGRNAIVNNGAVVEHDVTLGDHVHVASGAVLGGAARAGESAHIGLGAAVLQGVEVGSGSVVAAGAVVVHDVPARTVVAGVPAHPLRRS
jgi:UDP-perosamine 4-acetyltransferase